MFRYVNLLRNFQKNKILSRTFLSKEYKCANEWESRLSAPFMQKLKLENFFYDIDQNFHTHGKASAIDIDLFANKITPEDDHHLEEMAVLLKKFRLTEEATNILDSTGHAVVRHLADAGHITDLMNILDDRLNYGVFLDHYLTNYLMDHLIQKNNFTAAARIASQLMFQEDYENKLSNSFALYSCYKYLDNPELFYEIMKEENTDDKKEEVKVRVKFIRNEYFDNHFDLKNNLYIVGKTLLGLSKTIKTEFPQMSENVEFLGNFLYEKYGDCMNFLKSEEKNKLLYKDLAEKCLKLSEGFINTNKDLETNEDFKNVQASLGNIVEQNIADSNDFSIILENLVKENVKKYEKDEMEKQKFLYKNWNINRESMLNNELERLNRVKRVQEVENITKDLESEEQKLWFFENEEKYELKIDSKKVFYRKRWFGKKKKPRVIDEGYIPPEIVKGRK